MNRRFASIKLVVFDFDGVFTDNTVYVSEDGTETVRCWRGDGLGLSRLRQAGVETAVISTEANPVVTARTTKLSMRCVQSCPDKLAALKALALELGVALDEVAFVGNDINDLSCLEVVGLPIAVQDAHANLIPFVQYQTAAVGGRGAVREVCDLIITARQRQPE